MRKIGFLVGLVMLTGCAKAPVSTDENGNTLVNGEPVEAAVVENKPQDPNTPDSFGVVKVCGNGTKVYLLNGGAASGQYAIWNEQWELLAPGTTPDSVCSQ